MAKIFDFFNWQPILSSSIKVTRKCNLACQHCYVDTERGKTYKDELSLDEIQSIIDQLHQMGCMSLYINGGEPLLHPDIIKIYEYAQSKGFEISLSTNGLNVSEELLMLLRQFEPRLFQVSIDGLEKKHDMIRNTPNSFRNAIQTLKSAMRLFNDIPTTIIMATTLMRDNKNEINNLYDLATEIGVDTYALIPLIPTGKACPSIDITAKEKMEVIDDLTNHFLNSPKSTELSLILSPGLIPEKIRHRKYGEGYLCTFPNMIGIDSNGNVAPCDGLLGVSEMNLGNSRSETIENLWNKKTINKIKNISSKELKGVCSICKFLDKCRGGCRAFAYMQTGDYYSPDPLCQEVFDLGLFPSTSLNRKYVTK